MGALFRLAVVVALVVPAVDAGAEPEQSPEWVLYDVYADGADSRSADQRLRLAFLAIPDSDGRSWFATRAWTADGTFLWERWDAWIDEAPHASRHLGPAWMPGTSQDGRVWLPGIGVHGDPEGFPFGPVRRDAALEVWTYGSASWPCPLGGRADHLVHCLPPTAGHQATWAGRHEVGGHVFVAAGRGAAEPGMMPPEVPAPPASVAVSGEWRMWGLDEEPAPPEAGFTAREAYEVAMEDGRRLVGAPEGLPGFLDRHPGASLVRLDGAVSVVGTRVDAWWRLEFADGADDLHVDVARRSEPIGGIEGAPLHEEHSVHTEPAEARPSRQPGHAGRPAPRLVDLADAWTAWGGPSAPHLNHWGLWSGVEGGEARFWVGHRTYAGPTERLVRAGDDSHAGTNTILVFDERGTAVAVIEETWSLEHPAHRLVGGSAPGPDSSPAPEGLRPLPSVVTAGAGLGVLSFLLRWVWSAHFTRIEPQRALVHPTRRRIHEQVAAAPGMALSAVAVASEVGRNTARHHLRVLERSGLVRARRFGNVLRIYPNHAAIRPDVDHALRRPQAVEVLVGVRRGDDLRLLAEGLGVSYTTLHRRLHQLEGAGLLTLGPGRPRRPMLTAAGAAALDDLD